MHLYEIILSPKYAAVWRCYFIGENIQRKECLHRAQMILYSVIRADCHRNAPAGTVVLDDVPSQGPPDTQG